MSDIVNHPAEARAIMDEMEGGTMREILFRGKQLDDGEWVYGDIAHRKSRFAPETLGTPIGIADEYGTFKLVDPATVGQFTGLADKNGKKIFEGDVAETRTQDTGQLQRAEIRFGEFADINSDEESYIGFYIVFDGVTTTAVQLKEYTSFVEIIGNTHDNPELLGGAE